MLVLLILLIFTCWFCDRIQYREDQRLQKLEEKRQMHDRLQMEEIEREKRLDKLKATVCCP